MSSAESAYTAGPRPRWIFGPIGGLIALAIITFGGIQIVHWAEHRDCEATYERQWGSTIAALRPDSGVGPLPTLAQFCAHLDADWQ